MEKSDEDKLKDISKAILERDIKLKMIAKQRNSSYEPWKNPHVTVKQTPFGNFKGHKKPDVFDFSTPQKEYIPEGGSINVCIIKLSSAQESS
jgi:hypothetical protein